MSKTNVMFTREQWFTLPLKTRQRWWDETDYGRFLPSEALAAEIKALLKTEAA